MPVGIKDTLEIAALLDRSSKGADRERGKTMKYGYEILVKAAVVGVVLIASGCSLGNDEPLVDNLKGLETAFGNAGSNHDGGMPGNGGNRPAPGDDVAANDGGSSSDGGGDATGGTVTASDPDNGSGPGNSGFGRGTHANAGGGNGSETADGGVASAGNPDMDPGNSGNSNGRSMNND